MSTTIGSTLRYRFVPGEHAACPPLLLLHGTGGDENALVPLGQMVAPGAALLAPRGAVLENGMPRFFRRLAEGVFDEADLHRRTAELAEFVDEARARHDLAAPIAVGFSNGANIAATLLLLRPEVLRGAALLRPMVPLQDPPPTLLNSTPVLILSGLSDPVVPHGNAQTLAALLRNRGALVSTREWRAGHGLVPDDVSAVRDWLKAL